MNIPSVFTKENKVSESGLRKLDSVLYQGRKITLIVSSFLPICALISPVISYVAMGVLFGVGLISGSIFTWLDANEKGKLLSIKQAKEEKKDSPDYPKNIKGLVAMNITNKVMAFCAPAGVGFVMMLELTTLATLNIAILAGVVSFI